ncbi:MAG: ABC transporter permease [Planctomycetota bacterium]|nr:MAG: ABC transporter permease [Planctomycetota bacterium]
MNAVARRRLLGLIRKESLQIVRDPSSIAIAFLLPLLLLLIFGYGVSLDARRIPVAIVLEQFDAETTSFRAAFEHSEFFAPKHYDSVQAAEAALARREVEGIVWLRSDLEARSLADPPGRVQVIVNGVDANQGRILEGYVEGVWKTWLGQRAETRREAPTPRVFLQARVWFNPAVRSRDYLVPGLVAVIMTLIGALLTAMVVAREWERGTMEALLVTPVRMREILLGKLLPYFVLGMGGMLLSTAMAVFVFQVPLRGSFALLIATSSLFMLAALGMGLLISVVARSQFAAGQIAIVTTFLPAFILSGFIFDIGSMPAPIRAITHAIPARYFVAILQTLFLAGDVEAVVLPNALALVLMAGLFLGVVFRRSRKRLD